MKLINFLETMDKPQRKAFALRCGSSPGHLNNVAYECRQCSGKLAIAIERESKGAVTCEEVCPEADWAYVRNARRLRRKNTHASAA